MNREIAVAILALLIFRSNAEAQVAAPPVSKLLQADLDQRALATPAGRKALAEAVKGYCAEIDSVYPRNSPSEDQWLLGEISGGADRISRAAASPEWGRRQALLFVDGCRSWTAYLSKGEHTKGYVGLAYAFIRFSADVEFYARKNNVDPDRLGFPFAPRQTTEAPLLAALSSPQ